MATIKFYGRGSKTNVEPVKIKQDTKPVPRPIIKKDILSLMRDVYPKLKKIEKSFCDRYDADSVDCFIEDENADLKQCPFCDTEGFCSIYDTISSINFYFNFAKDDDLGDL